jgi:aryl-alcohol dehydrogenase-like predicted oxidoreductase
MKYRKLGNTGLIVSELALGTMQFGGKMNMGNLGEEDTTRMVKLALDRGIKFVDTADVYILGESETLVGKAMPHMGFSTKRSGHKKRERAGRMLSYDLPPFQRYCFS